MPERGAMAGLERPASSVLVEAVGRQIATEFIASSTTSRTTMAAAASTLNSSSSREIQLRIWTGRAVNWLVSPSGLKVTKVSAPAAPPVRLSEARPS